MNARIQACLDESKRRIDARLDKTDLSGAEEPMFTASNIHYEQAERTRATPAAEGATSRPVTELHDSGLTSRS